MSGIDWTAVEEIYREHVPASVGGTGNFIGRMQNVLRLWADQLRAQGGEGVHESKAVLDFASRLSSRAPADPAPARDLGHRPPESDPALDQ